MKVCVTGKGGREHALAWAFARAGHDVVVSPGNAGIPWSGDVPDDADLYVLGPEDHITSGMGDRLRADGKLVFGAGADGGQLEGSKAWMKDLLAEAGVPTARYGTFTDLTEAKAFMRTLHGGVVVKTDYLAAGKGVLVTDSYAEACADAEAKLANGAIVVEELLAGPEVSLFAVCDGERAVALPLCQDHKRVGDGDTGPNTGGMGAYSPVPFDADDAMETCVLPTLDALRRRGIDYRGVLFAGLMLTADGPKVLEYNVRFGDPETEVVVPRLTTDLGALCRSAAAGEKLPDITFADDACVTVVIASEGYPAEPRTGDAIDGLDAAAEVDGAIVFHAGTRRDGNVIRTAGGRVLAVSAIGETVEAARARAYEAAERISWPGAQYRRDIAAAVADGAV